MTDDDMIASIQPPPPPPPMADEDLSAEIACGVPKRPGDTVRCTRVFGDNYRCNWWAPQPTGGYDNPGMGGLVVTTHRVRRSRFLHASRHGGRLVIREVA